MEIAPYINASFTPSAAPAGTTPADHLANGLYAYINADKDPELKKRADATFGRTVPFDNSETQATLIGRSFASHTGYRQNPVQFLRDNKLPIPPNWSGENAQLYTQIGQHIISKYQEHYNNEKIKRDKAIADAQKDITDSFNRLPEAIADSVLQADGITSHTALDKDLLQTLTKYNQGENALTAQKRAALAWQYIAPAFESVDHLQDTNRRLLLDIANALSDEKGQLDPHALAAFVMLTDKKATELQSTNSEFWADFADKFQNFWRTTDDQIKKNGGLAYSNWRDAQGIMPERPAYYGDERVEKLYGYMNQAINTAISPSEKAEWYAKLLSEMGGLVGESIVPMAAGIVAGAALAPAGAFAAAVAGYGAGVAASAPSTINNTIGNAYIKGVINPELYGTLEGIGQAAAENIGGPATSLKLFTKTAGKLTNYAASRAAGSRFLANQYARTTLNYLTAGAFESVTELAEEELGGFIGSKLNAIARSMGFEVSPQAYQLGETLKDMKSHEVAAIFGYSYTLGLFGVPANFRDARNFAKNTDNLLKAGHTAKAARDIQLKVFQTEDKIADIIANPSLTQEQKDAAIRKEEQSLTTYQQSKFINDALSDPKLRSRLEQEGRILRDEIEVALDVEHEADLQILKEHNILEAVVIPGEKYKVSIYEPGELQQDGTRAPGKITTQEWSRMQLTNWLMLQKDTRIEQDLRAFQSLLLSHAHAQSATLEETKALFQNLGENRPLAALGELHKHGITPAFFQKAAHQALQLQLRHQQEGMTPQQAAQQPSPDFQGLSLGQVQSLATAASQRAEQEIATTGALQNITEDTSIEYGGINLLTADGTALIKYVAGRATILDMLEERFEADIKQRTRGNQTLLNQLAETLLHIQSHLPGNIQLLDPKKKGNYTKSDLVEAYSKIAIGAFLYNEKNLPINAAGHRLIQNIGRAVDTTRMYQTIGNAWLTYANSPEGKAHLEAGGQTIADIMQEAGFTFSNQLASARATAQQRAQVLEARNYQPDIEQEVKALMDSAQQEQQLAEINQQEAKEPITIPADQSITGKEITVEPERSDLVDSIVNLARAKANLKEVEANITRSIESAEKARKEYKKHLNAYKRLAKKYEGKTWKNKQEADFRQSELEASKEYADSFLHDAERAESDIVFWRKQAEKYRQEIETLTPIVSSDSSAPSSEQETLVSPETPPAAPQSKHGTSVPTTTLPTQEELENRTKEAIRLFLASDKTAKKKQKRTFNSLTRLSEATKRIKSGKGSTKDYAVFFRSHGSLTEAQAIEQGVRVLNQKGEPLAAYTLGRLIADRFTNAEYEAFIYDVLTKNELDALLTSRTDEGIIKQANELTPKQLPKSPKWPTLPKKGATEQQQREAIIKSLLSSISTDKTRYILNHILHTISGGVETFVATDGRRLSVITRPAPQGSKDINETLDKEGNPVDVGNYPNWQKVMIPALGNSGTLDLAPYRFAEGIIEKTRKVEVPYSTALGTTDKYTTETYIPAEKWKVEGDSRYFLWQNQNKLLKFSPTLIRDAIKLFSSMGKAHGIPSSVSVDIGADGQMLWHSEHNGWTVDHLLMPIRIQSRLGSEGIAIANKGDILLNPQQESPANFSIRAANPSTLDRFTADPLGERIVHTVRTEARRYARVLGDKTPQEQAMNAIASAESIINAVDKYLHRPDKPVSRRHRNQLTKLRSIIEKYAQIIASGTPRSFKRISPAEQQELQAAIAELEAAELDTAETDPARLIEDSDRTTKRTRDARAAELRRRIVREAAKGRVYKVLAAMLDTAADALDDYLKDQLLTKLHRLTATVAIKRTPSKRLKGKMTAPMYRELEQAIQLMAYSTRQKEDAIDTILTAHETLAQAIAANEDNLTRGNSLLIELAHQLEQDGTPVTAQTLTAALAAHEARVAIFADIDSKNYEQTRTAANAIYHIIRYGRALWQQKHEAREAEIQTYLRHFLANTTAEQGTEQATRTASEEEQKESGLTRFANSMMNSMQLFHALSGIDALAPLMEHTQRSLATANVARDLHMKQMVTHVQAVYGLILGIKPATEAGYSDKQLEEISKKLDKFYAENNQREATGITRHYIDADGKHKQEELELTKWQALDLILTYRQQHYRPNAEHHGYTDKVLDALEKWCGTNLMELGEAMQKSLINDGTIAVYEEREGIPLRENPLYWPGHLNIAEQDAPDHPVISNPYHGASSYKFLKGRTNNLREVSARNAYNVWKSAIAERANYVYLAPVTDIFNSLLARKEFAARLKTIIGPSLYNQLRLTLREIDGTTWAETSLQEDPHNAVSRALRNMAPALLAGNPTTLIRQASAVANATLMPDFPPHEFAKQLVQLQQNQSGITIGRVLKLPVFQARARDNSALNEMLALGTDAKYSSYANLARKFMGYIDAMDTFCNAIGATIYYNYKYEQYTRENNENGNILTDAEIHAKCENDIAIMLALTAQPLKRTDKSAFFWRNSKTVLGPLYLYMGSELINKVGMARANWIKRKAEGMGSIKNTSLWLYSLGAGVGAVAFLTELAVAYLTGNTPDDDDSLSAWLIATYINSAYGQYTSQMPVIGQITDLFTSPYSSLFGTISQIPGVKTIQSGKKIGKMLTDDKAYSGAEWQAQLTRLARDLNGVAGYAGGVNSHMPWLTVTSSILQSITTAMNIANFFSTGVRNDAFYADWFPDWYKEAGTRKRKPRRSKSLVEQWLTPDNK